jgi:hypothetical protein
MMHDQPNLKIDNRVRLHYENQSVNKITDTLGAFYENNLIK